MKVGQDDYEVIEPGTYPATVLEWTDKDQFGKPLMSTGFADREPAPQYKFKFAVDTGEGEPRNLSAWVNKPKDENAVSPKSKLYELAKATLGDAIETTEWDVPDFLDKPLRVQVEVYEKSAGGEGNKISKFYGPARKRAAAPPPDDAEDEQPPAKREPVGAGRKTPF